MIKTTLFCDECKKIIEPTKGIPGYYLTLDCVEYTEYKDGVCYAVVVLPPFADKKIFHNFDCLEKYLEKRK